MTPPHAPACEICRQQGQWDERAHWKWHDVAAAEMNPVVLFQFIEALPQSQVTIAILGFVVSCTGLDVDKMRAALKAEENL